MAGLQKLAPLRRQGKVLSTALYKLHAETPLQRTYLLTDSTLRDAIHLRRLGKTRAFRQIGKDLE